MINELHLNLETKTLVHYVIRGNKQVQFTICLSIFKNGISIFNREIG